MKNSIFIFALLFISQFNAQELPEIVPPSPEAQAFEKYGNIPVNTYTGIPNISIPLYTIQHGDISVPITLSYHASGVKVDEEASTVGLGWVLNAGGIISRNIYGDDDFRNNYNAGGEGKAYITNNVTDIIMNSMPSTGVVTNSINSNNQNLDCSVYINGVDFVEELGYSNGYGFQPDQFTYNIQGLSGKFALKRNGEAFLAKDSKIKIEYDITALQDNGFTVTGPDGIVYSFKEGGNRGLCGNANVNQGATSWLLENITSPSTDKYIDFVYKDFDGTPVTPALSTVQTSNEYVFKNDLPSSCSALSSNASFPCRTYAEEYLDYIDFPNGRVLLIYEAGRLDLSGGKSLKSIKVYAKNHLGNVVGDPIKEFQFEYEYFDSEGGYETVIDDPSTNFNALSNTQKGYINKRLKLKKVYEVGKPGHVFTYYNEYDSSIFKGKGTYSKDHWGYLNGGSNSLIPAFKGIPPFGSSSIVTLAGGNRNPDPSKVAIFSLKEIEYPTGGRTEFLYESNTYDYAASIFNNNATFRDLNIFDNPGEIRKNHTHLHFPSQPGQGNMLETTFTIPNGNGNTMVDFTVFLQCASSNPTCDQLNISDSSVLLELPDGTLSYPQLCANGANQGPDQCSVNATFTVGPGTYTIKSVINTAEISSLLATFGWYENASPPAISFGGGQRIREIRDYDGATNDPKNIKTFDYHYTDPGSNTEMSHGLLMAKPLYEYTTRDLPSDCDRFWRTSNSVVNLSRSAIGYSQVTVSTGANGELGKSIFHYRNQPDIVQYLEGFRPNVPALPFNSNGLLEKRQDFDTNGDIVREIENTYTPETISIGPNSQMLMGVHKNINRGSSTTPPNEACFGIYYLYPSVISNWIKLESMTERTYENNSSGDAVTQNTVYEYGPGHQQVVRTTMTNSKNESVIDEKKYAEDLNQTNLINKHMHSQVLWSQKKVDGSVMETNQIDYATSGLAVLEGMKYSKGGDPLESRIVYHSYDNVGNPLEVSKSSGPRISYVWGYRQEYPIAKIENVSYEDMSTAQLALITDAQTASDNDDDRTVDSLDPNGATTYVGNEGTLREKQDAIRTAFPQAMVTTYTYDPLIGPTSMTDPRGYTTYYNYDDFNRLKEVKDAENLLIEDYKYQYKTQD